MFLCGTHDHMQHDDGATAAMLLVVGINWILAAFRGAGTKRHTTVRALSSNASASPSMNGSAVQDSKRVKMSSIFSQLEVVPQAEPFHMKDLFLADESPDKINLSVGGELLYL